MVPGNRSRSASCQAFGVLAGALVGLVLLAGCSGGAGGSAPPRAAGPPTGEGPTAPTLADQNTQLCHGYAVASGSARTPLDAMRGEAVLLPFIDLIELSTEQAAQRASAAPDPAVAAAMREVVAAIDDLDAQGRARLPAGTDPSKTTVRLDPGRLAGALDGADRACVPHTVPLPGGH
jgi:hypothetical protein